MNDFFEQQQKPVVTNEITNVRQTKLTASQEAVLRFYLEKIRLPKRAARWQIEDWIVHMSPPKLSKIMAIAFLVVGAAFCFCSC